MKLKLVALDLDGTLLNHDELISPRNANAILTLQNQGVAVTIASGRSYREAREICDASGVRPYIISSNGAGINDRDGKLVAGFAIDRNLAIDLAKWLEENEYYYELTGDFDVFAPQAARERHSENFEAYKRANPSPDALLRGLGLEYKLSLRKIGVVKSYREFFSKEENTYKIHVLAPELDRLEQVKQKFRALRQLEMVSSLDHNAEVMNAKASKGASVKRLADLLGIPLTSVMAVGDNLNDLSMLKLARYSVAMGNARPEVKSICKYTTLADRDDGVAHAIEQFDQINWNEKAR